MKKNLTFFIFLLIQVDFFGCCAGDDRTLTELLFQGKVGTVFSCKIITMIVPNSFNEPALVSSSGGIDGTAIAKIIHVYFGNVDTTIVTLKTASLLTEGKCYLIYSEANGKVFYCGGNCDNRTHQLTGSPEEKSELEILNQFATIYKNKKSGKFTFLSHTKKPLAIGEFIKGVPVKLWKHFNTNGSLKTEQDIDAKRIKHYNPNGLILSDVVEFKDSTISIAYSETGLITYRYKTIPNTKGYIMTMYEFYSNGNLKLQEGVSYINVQGGISTDGKIGQYIEGFDNGKIKVTGELNKSRRIGIWKWYDEAGNFVAEYDYKDGTTAQ